MGNLGARLEKKHIISQDQQQKFNATVYYINIME